LLHRLTLAAAAVAVLCIGAPPAGAAETLLRDAEVENDIKTMAAPIWRAAGLEPSDVGVYLVQDNSLNSFVAGELS
jgi:predicted Zn-dependent protease